jgi:hypothetical protein
MLGLGLGLGGGAFNPSTGMTIKWHNFAAAEAEVNEVVKASNNYYEMLGINVNKT